MRDLITVVGLNHKTAPVEVREKLSFQESQLTDSFRELNRLEGVKESAILSTCNRVEVYTVFQAGTSNTGDICGFLSRFHQVPLETFENCIYALQDDHAIRHIFRVASSLDSMVVGEPQILGQFKDAYGLATQNKATGLILNRLFHKAFSVAKRVRTETRIANSAVSISFAAVELAKKIFDDLSTCRVLLIGAGEMCELAAKHFINAGIYEIYITNRTFNRAIALAEDFGGEAIPFTDYNALFEKVDIILTSTGATEPIVTADVVAAAMKKRKNRPMFFIDIAVPRDVEEKVHDLSNVYLYDIDDLKEVVTSNQQEREKEAK
ncbi:MAG: glutamyl-tRNA reductase, partial [Deltaproteobacteria bacterium]